MSITTAVAFSGSSRIRRAASSPSSSGMRTSISTTSGRRPAHDVDRLAPVGGLPDHAQVGLGVEDHAEAGPQQPLVVGDHDA